MVDNYSLASSSYEIKPGEVTDICTLVKCITSAIFLIFLIIVIGGFLSLIVAMPIIELVFVFFMDDGLFRPSGNFWSSFTNFSFGVYILVIFFALIQGLVYGVKKTFIWASNKIGNNDDEYVEQIKNPSMMKLWGKSLKEKTCIYIELE